jgi:hypothetical protein
LLKLLTLAGSAASLVVGAACSSSNGGGGGIASGTTSGTSSGSTATTSSGTTTGTSSGTTGGPPCPYMTSKVTLVDNLALTTGSLPSPWGGAWYTYDDGAVTGSMTTITPAAMTTFAPVPIDTILTVDPCGGENNSNAANVTGKSSAKSACTGCWGAGFGFDFAAPPEGGAAKATVDLSTYEGILFYGKVGPTPLATSSVQFNISDSNTDSSIGACLGTANDSSKCDPYQETLTFTTSWKVFSIKWTDTAWKQSNWGTQYSTFNASKVVSAHWQVGPGVTFDLWLDDIYLIDNGA